MKNTNFIILILTLTSITKCVSERNFNLHKKDTLSIQISDILSYSDLTNDLKTVSKNLNVQVPPVHKKIDINMVWEIEGKTEKKPGFKIEKIYDQTNYGDYFVSLVKTDEIDNLLIISEVNKNGQTLSITSKISQIASNDLHCDNVVMETEKVYTGCISESENYFYICEKYYKDDTKPVCEFYDFNYTFKKGELKDELIKLNLFVGNNNDVVILMFLKYSKIEYFQNKFLLKINEKSSFLSLPFEHNFNITKIKLINYLSKTSEVNCLISGEVKTPQLQNQLYHMKIISGIIDKEFLQKSLINNTLKSFDQFNSDILIYEEFEEEDQKDIKITEMNLENLTKKYFFIKNQNKLVRADLGFNKAVIETLNNKNEKEFFFYDTNSKRLSRSDINISENERWFIMSVLDNNFFFIFDYVDIIGNAYFLNTQRTIDIKNENESDSGTVDIKFNGKTIYSIHIDYYDFDQSLNYIKPQLQCIEGRSNNVKIDYYTNDMKINNHNINYFSKMNIKGDISAIEKCNPVRVFFNQDLFIYFCWDKRILNFKSVFYKDNDLILSDAVFYKSDLQFDFDLIKSVKLYYGKILLILMNNMRIIWTDLSKNTNLKINVLDFEEFEYLTDKYENCSWNNQGLICIKDNNYEQLSIEIRNSIIEIDLISKKSVEQIKLKNNYFNSFYDRYYKLSLQKDKFYEKEIFQGCKVNCDLSIDTQLDLNEDTLTYMITQKNFVLINHDENNNLVIHGIINGSIIKYPTENYIKEYKEILLVNNSLYENLFVVFYKTVRNTTRALLYKGTLEVSQRLIQEFLVDEEECNEPKAYSQISNSNSFIIYYSCEDSVEKKYIWKFKMDGPLYKSIGNETEDTLIINGKEVNLNFFYFNKKNDFDVTSKDISLNGSTDGQILKDLESEGNITITGDVVDCKIRDLNLSGVEIIKRTHQIETSLVPIFEEKIKENENLKSCFNHNNFLLTLGDYILVDKQLKNTANYKECIFVNTTYNSSGKDLSQTYLCRGELSLKYYLTDFDKLDVLIDPQYLESNLKVFKAYMIRLKEEMYLVTSVNKNHKVLNVIKISESDKNPSDKNLPYDVINSSFLYVDSYYDMVTSFSNFFITFDKDNSEIVLFLHPQYSSRLLILNFPLNEDKINLRSRNIVEINYGKQLEIFKIEFFDLIDEKNITRVGALFTTNYHLYEANFNKNSDIENWNFKIINEWYNQSGNSKESDIINFNDHFVSLTLRRGVHNVNTLFWKREVDEKKFVHSSIGKNLFGDKDYKIADVNMISMGGKHYTYVTYYHEMINEGEWKDVRVKIFESGNLQIKLDLDKLRYKESVNLKFVSIASETKDIYIELTLEENFKIFIFTLSLIILLIIMASLIIFVIVLYNGNKKLKSDLERDLRENNMTNNLA